MPQGAGNARPASAAFRLKSDVNRTPSSCLRTSTALQKDCAFDDKATVDSGNLCAEHQLDLRIDKIKQRLLEVISTSFSAFVQLEASLGAIL